MRIEHLVPRVRVRLMIDFVFDRSAENTRHLFPVPNASKPLAASKLRFAMSSDGHSTAQSRHESRRAAVGTSPQNNFPVRASRNTQTSARAQSGGSRSSARVVAMAQRAARTASGQRGIGRVVAVTRRMLALMTVFSQIGRVYSRIPPLQRGACLALRYNRDDADDDNEKRRCALGDALEEAKKITLIARELAEVVVYAGGITAATMLLPPAVGIRARRRVDELLPLWRDSHFAGPGRAKFILDLRVRRAFLFRDRDALTLLLPAARTPPSLSRRSAR